MKKLLALAAATAAAIAVPAHAAITKNVRVDDDYFVRVGPKPTVTVKKNDTVKWIWRGDVVHNVSVTKGPQKFHSKTIVKGSYSRKMIVRGTYQIVCTIHPGMAMKLVVK
ncbi:MAG: plastocyanin/azurin family copper-binding protein [Solirubrobacteraceae bacterium]